MPQQSCALALDHLLPLMVELLAGIHLPPSCRAEFVRVAQGLSTAESAELAGLTKGTVRIRRRKVCKALGARHAHDLQARLLALALRRAA